MKKFLIGFALFFIVESVLAGDAPSCEPINSITAPRNIEMTLKTLGSAFTVVEITDSNDPKLKIKPAQLKRSTDEQINLIAGTTIKPGDTITTGKNQTVSLKLFMPTAQEYKIFPNSEMIINSFSEVPGKSLVNIRAGRVELSGEHRKSDAEDSQNDSSHIGTPLCETTAIGTKYSVDLNDAIAEASGSDIQAETYGVQKGEIKIKLRRANKFTKLNIKSKRKDFKVSKNGVFKLKAGQKARLKVNRKTKVADIEVIEP